MSTLPKATTPASATVKSLLQATSHYTRWQILQLLLEEGPNTALPMTKRLGVELSNLSRHLAVLRASGLIEQTVGRVQRIPEKHIIPGEKALNYGHIILRFDQGKAGK